jgi:hypothetical protein
MGHIEAEFNADLPCYLLIRVVLYVQSYTDIIKRTNSKGKKICNYLHNSCYDAKLIPLTGSFALSERSGYETRQ